MRTLSFKYNRAAQRRLRVWRLLAGLAISVASCYLPTPARAAPPLIAPAFIEGQFLGQAGAVVAQALVGPLSVGLANAASAACPCRGTNGHHVVSKFSTLSIGPAGAIASAGVNTSTAYGLKTQTTATTTQTTNIAKLNLLGGLITADLIRSVANVSVTSTALVPVATGTGFRNLVIAGTAIKPNIAQNTVIALAGLGSVTVKFVNAVTYGNQAAGVEVEMLRIAVDTPNSLGITPGSIIIVGEAFAGYDRTQPGATLGGTAETLAVSANAGTLLQEAATGGALSGIGSCSGTAGATLSDTVASVSAGGLLSLGVATTTAYGGQSGTAYVANTTSSVANISLLGGVITATGVVAAAGESRSGKMSTATTLGSNFGDLLVAGVPVANNVAPNTVIGLAGIGYVVLNEQPPASKGSVQVNGLHIVVNLSNSLGLPIGTEIFVAHADATAAAF